jgi:signal transduction histidine kinase
MARIYEGQPAGLNQIGAAFENLLYRLSEINPARDMRWTEYALAMLLFNLLGAVADTGPGLAPGEEDRLFDKFYRASPESVTLGAGLGLAICRAIINAHGGRIWAENRPEGGAVFRFLIPR